MTILNHAFGETPASTERSFVKMHGLRNHFVIFDRRRDRRAFRRADIVRICDPQVGVGGDQVLTIEPPSPEGAAAGATGAMRIFNIDGREVSACGNATRCVAHFLMEEAGVDALVLETKGGMLKCRRTGAMDVSVELGPIGSNWRDFPLSHEVDMLDLPVASGALRHGMGLWIGNPHAVFFVDDLAAFAARLKGLTDSTRFTVHLPAGPLRIEIRGTMALMSGPVAYCCRGFVAAETVYDFD